MVNQTLVIQSSVVLLAVIFAHGCDQQRSQFSVVSHFYSLHPFHEKKALSLRFLENKIIASQHEVKDIFILDRTTGTGAEATCMLEVRKCLTAEPQHLQSAVHEKINFLNHCFCRFLSGTLTAYGSLC